MDHEPRILIVDDDREVLALMRQVLEPAGFKTEVAEGGLAAIQRIEAARPTLVTLDLVMPDVDGWGVLAHLRRIPAPPPVVVVTGHPDSVGPFSVMASVAAYLVKPFSSADLVATCRKVAAGRFPRSLESDERRRDGRRLFVVGARVIEAASGSLASGHVVELSETGLRVDVDLALKPGQTVEVAFRVPGYKEALKAKCVVRWREGLATGLQLVDVPPEQTHMLGELMRPLGKTPVA
jgi:DNA-binding response OmpR family regulator